MLWNRNEDKLVNSYIYCSAFCVLLLVKKDLKENWPEKTRRMNLYFDLLPLLKPNSEREKKKHF